jgi:hypothetical protein
MSNRMAGITKGVVRHLVFWGQVIDGCAEF